MNQGKSLSKIFLCFVLLAVVAVSSTLLLACGETKYTITWELSHATVSVSGYDKAPDKIAAGTEVKFTITPDSGYKVSHVEYNEIKISPVGSDYFFVVNADTKVIVKAEREVTALTILTNPTKLEYFAGESLDKAGLTLTATYATGETEPLPAASVSVSPSVFAGGDDKVTISYGGKSAVIQLDSVVENLVTIDPKGGTLSATAIALFSGQNNYSYDTATGIIMFSYYENLGSGIKLPVEPNISREDHTFVSWTGAVTKIDNTSGPLKLEANWEVTLVKIHLVDIQNRTEGGTTTSYLIIRGIFYAAEEAYLYLYEGNDEVSLNGDAVSGSKGEEFELLFDLKKLSDEQDGSYMGKWMDIRFKATYGNKEVEMQVFTANPDLTVNLSARARNNGFAYSFKTFTPEGGVESLKVVFESAANIKYEYEYDILDGGVLKITGIMVDEALFGKTVRISWYNGTAETDGDFGEVDAEGNWTVEIDLTQLPLNTNTFAHITVFDAEDKVVFGSDSTNLLVSACLTSIPKLAIKAGNDVSYAVRLWEDDTAYYVGYAWDGLMAYIIEEDEFLVEAPVLTGNTLMLEVIDEKPYVVITGTFEGEAAGFGAAYFDFQLADVWSRIKVKLTDFTISGGTFTFKADLSSFAAGTHIMHLNGDSTNFMVETASGSITAGGKVYTIVPNYNNWSISGILVAAAE